MTTTVWYSSSLQAYTYRLDGAPLAEAVTVILHASRHRTVGGLDKYRRALLHAGVPTVAVAAWLRAARRVAEECPHG
jgi:hypothetical protein